MDFIHLPPDLFCISIQSLASLMESLKLQHVWPFFYFYTLFKLFDLLRKVDFDRIYASFIEIFFHHI